MHTCPVICNGFYYILSRDYFALTKGQITSEQNCGVLNFPKKQRNYFKDFCPSHPNKKDQCTLSYKLVITYHLI